jgi:hypothetical protein
MIVRSAPPLTVRTILDHLGHSAAGLWLHQCVRLLLGGNEPRLATGLRPASRGGGIPLRPWQRMVAAFGDWSSVSELAWRGETPSDDRTDRFRRFCHDCEEDTPHEGFDEFGPGWYAQICRCGRCGKRGHPDLAACLLVIRQALIGAESHIPCKLAPAVTGLLRRRDRQRASRRHRSTRAARGGSARRRRDSAGESCSRGVD